MRFELILAVILLTATAASAYIIVPQTATINEPFEIQLLTNGSLRIETQEASYRQLGQANNSVFFTPTQQGNLSIHLLNPKGDIIASANVTVNKTITLSNTPPSEVIIQDTQSQDNPSPKNILHSRSKALPAQVKVINGSTILLDRPSQEIAQGVRALGIKKATIEIIPYTKGFRKLKLFDANPNQIDIGFDIPARKDVKIKKRAVMDTFAIDPSKANFSRGELTRVATGSQLYKCQNWNFTQSKCLGSWKKIMDLTPGEEYTLEITPQDPGFAETGVATINTLKPIYEPNEMAQFVMGILDTQGYLVDNASIILTITSPSNQTATLSTPANIYQTSKGIYETSMLLGQENGTYAMEVYATAPGVNMSMFSSFQVQQNYPYDILRNAPVSIDPWKGPFQTSIAIFAHNSSQDPIDVIETLPLDYIVTSAPGAIHQKTNTSNTLTWYNVSLGSTLTYYLQAPLQTPDVDVLGEIAVVTQNSVQIEARPWFIAVDPTNILTPIVNANTEVGGTDLSGAQVTAITTDDGSNVVVDKAVTLTAELSNPTNTSPIASVNSLSCSLVYLSEDFSPAATFRVDDAFGGNQLGITTFSSSVGSDATVSISDLHLDADFQIADLQTMVLVVINDDSGKPQTLSVDRLRCTVDYTLLDIQDPTVSLNQLQEGVYLDYATIAFNYTPVDDRSFQNCSLYIDDAFNQLNTSSIINNSINTISSTISEGSHNWSVSCFDTTGNSGTSGTRNFTIDLTSPTAFNLLSPINQTVSTDLTPLFTWGQTTETNFRNYTLELDNNADFSSPNYIQYTLGTVTNTSYQFQTIIASNTQYYWRVTAHDLAGHSTQSTQTYTYTTDTLAPSTFSLTAPATGTVTANRTPTLNWTVTTETNFVNYTIYFDDNSDFSSPEHTYVVTQRTTNNYDIQPIEQLTADTRFYWRIIAYDAAGQTRTTTSRSYRTDNTPPQVTLQAPDNESTETFSNNIDFNYTSSDVVSDVSSCELIINSTTEQTENSVVENTTQTFNQFLSNGDYNWRVECVDEHDNTNSSGTYLLTVNVLIDNTPPTITLNSPLNNSYQNSQSVFFNYTPNDATGIDSCSIFIDGSLNRTDSQVTAGQWNNFTVPGLSEISHTWRITCTDNSTSTNQGNSSQRVFIVDVTNPTAVSLLAPADTLRTNDPTQALDWSSTTETNFRNYTILLDDDSSFFSPNYRFFAYTIANSNYTTPALEDNMYYWRIISYDQAGNSQNSTQTYSFEIDTTAPRLENLTETPSDPIQYDPNRLYNFTVDVGGSDIDTVLFQHNFVGTSSNYTPNGSIGNSYYFTISGIDVGSYTYKWHANDTLNNWNATTQTSYTITQNITTITLTLDDVAANRIINESTILNLTATLNHPIDATVLIYRNQTLLGQSTTPYSILHNFTIPGSYYINASHAGNSNYAASQQIWNVTVLDNVAPTISLITPLNLSTDVDGIVTYFYNVTDTATVTSCTLYIDDVANGTTNSPSKDTTLTFQRTYTENANLTWQVRCIDGAGQVGNSSIYNLTIDLAILTQNLVPFACVEETSGGGCTASNVNISDGTYEDHQGMTKNQFNYVNVSLYPTTVPPGATILNVTVEWDKYQARDLGTFFIYWRNGTNWQTVCSQAFTTSSTATPDPLTCDFSALPSRTQLNDGLKLRGGWNYGNGPSNAAYETDFVQLTVQYQEDVTDPVVALDDPQNAVNIGEGSVIFNFTAQDQNLENCSLYGDFNGSFHFNQTITVQDTLNNDAQSSFSPIFLSVGFYTWNILCYDIADNAAFAPQNYTINITPPDLTVTSQGIIFDNNDPLEDQNITINATILNNGLTAAENFIVRFFLGDPDTTGVQINGDQVITSLSGQSNTTVNVSYIVLPGANNIYVQVDSTNVVAELSESNNKANKTLFVDSYFMLYGDATANITLDAGDNETFYYFQEREDVTGNIFFVRSGYVPQFLNLQALGVNTQGDNTSDDFGEADILLNMTQTNDSINRLWANDTNRPLQVLSHTIYSNTVELVPIIDSDASGNFTTGILWDTSTDTDTQFGLADNEPLVFVTSLNQAAWSDFGIQDYVAKVPALLRSYNDQPTTTLTLFVEIT